MRSHSTLTPNRQPFLYLTTGLVTGIVADRWIEPVWFITTGFVVALSALTFCFFVTKRDVCATSALLLAFVATGALLSLKERTATDTIPRLKTIYESKIISPDEPVELTGTLAFPPEPAPGAVYLDLTTERLQVRGEPMLARGAVRLMLSTLDPEANNEFKNLALDYGSRFRVLVRLERAKEYGNPGSPDFNDFLERRGFDLKGVIKSPLLIERLGTGYTNRLLLFLYHLRMRMLSALDSSFTPAVAGTLKAMLTGNRYFLDTYTIGRLQQASTFHTLVIAGLHIGILAWALLGGRSGVKRRHVWRVVVCVMILWSYAVMVGMAPPVTRATAMITIGLIGPLLFRRSTSINAVSLAAFVMLALKPALVTDPGFQLSFVAVAGIVTLAIPLTEKLRRIGDWRPTSATPHPPACSRAIRYLAETLFWDERNFNNEMRHSPVRYRLEKSSAARLLGRWRIQPLVRDSVLIMLTSTAIQLSTLPLMAFYFNRVAPVGVLLNVIAGLLTGVLMLSALATIALSGVSAWLVTHIGVLVNAAHYLLVRAIEPFIDIPFATFRVAHYNGRLTVVYALYFLPIGLIAVLIDRWQPIEFVLPGNRIATLDSAKPNQSNPPGVGSWMRALPTFSAVAFIACLVSVIDVPTDSAVSKLTVHFLDVGQGDSAFIIFPRGRTMLVDGGGELQLSPNRSVNDDIDGAQFSEGAFSIGEAVVSRFIWSLGRTRVDYLCATHADADHIGGLSAVARNFRVGELIIGHAPDNDPEFDFLARTVRRNRIPVSMVQAGERFDIDGVTVEVMWPPPASGTPVTSGNNDSVVLRLAYGPVSVLLTGDIEQAAEESLVASHADLRADILKVPHHGSKTSSSEAFINAVNPKYAVISVGERSRFGHPHASVVNRYVASGVRILQTGVSGTVTVEIDRDTYRVKTYRKDD
jgi:competence protein ComEC